MKKYKLYKCHCQIVNHKKREKLKDGGQVGSGDYYCFGCDSYFSEFTLFNYIIYVIGSLFNRKEWAMNDWIDFKYKILGHY
jgi:hypothetical protein